LSRKEELDIEDKNKKLHLAVETFKKIILFKQDVREHPALKRQKSREKFVAT
jgi:hypothetical protein